MIVVSVVRGTLQRCCRVIKGGVEQWDVPLKGIPEQEVEVEIWQDWDSTSFTCESGELTREGVIIEGVLIPFQKEKQ